MGKKRNSPEYMIANINGVATRVPKPEPKIRHCLGLECSETFLSNGERFCPKCRTKLKKVKIRQTEQRNLDCREFVETMGNPSWAR